MKTAKLIHNPGAGDEEHSKEELISVVEAHGFNCTYSSTKMPGWQEIGPEIDFLIAAGGDGTVRKIVRELLDRKVLEHTWPIALLPLGTANNIAATLGISGSTEEIIESWLKARPRKYDVGRIFEDAESEPEFFLEAFGCGIFPYLIQEMKKRGKDSIEDPERQKQAALELLHEIVLCYEPRNCKLEVDGIKLSGKFLLAEVMNMRSIGPNLLLAPDADPSDGELEVVLVPEEHKDRFASFVLKKMSGHEEPFSFQTLKGKNIRIRWDGTHIHADDKIHKLSKGLDVKIELRPAAVEFLLP